MKEKEFEIGDWVYGEKGIGQLMYIRELYVESFVKLESYEKIEEDGVYRRIYGVKHLCDLDGKIFKKNNLIFSAGIAHIDKKGLRLVSQIKEKKIADYKKYIVFDELDISEYIFRLSYFVDKNSKTNFVSIVNEICYELLPNFTFDDFKKEFSKRKTEIDINSRENGSYISPQKSKDKIEVSFVFYSRNCKVVNKKRIFSGVRCIINE